MVNCSAIMEGYNKKYLKCKLIVKKWESEFKENHGRKPTKVDIKNAPQHIKEAYKMYWNLKTITLETSLVNVSFDDMEEFSDVPLSSSIADNIIQSNMSVDESNNTISCEKDMGLNEDSNIQSTNSSEKAIDHKNSQLIENSEKPSNQTNSISVWGNHLSNTTKNLEEKSKLQKPVVLSHFTSKLFAGASFKKRNPRKSFMRREKSNNSSTLEDESFTSKKHSGLEDSPCREETSTYFKSKSYIELEKQNVFSNEDLDDQILNKKTKILNHKNLQNNSSQPLSVLQKSLTSNSKVIPLVNKNVDTGWLNRLEKQVSMDSEKYAVNSSDSGIDLSDSRLICNQPKSLPPISSTPNDNDVCDSADFVCDSDSGDEKTKSFCSFGDAMKSKSLVSKNLTEECSVTSSIVNENNPICIKDNGSKLNKRLISDVETDVFTSIAKRVKINSSVSVNHFAAELNNTVSKAHFSQEIGIKENILQTKEMKQKEILQKKVSSGKANENFVKINIKKKTYARGKKTMTFQKYKKQKWKDMKKNQMQNKTGVLKCFKCGDIGHFSKNCQKVSNELLPLELLDDDEEESPFPTLQEAEELALEASKKLCVRRNLHELPLHVTSDDIDAGEIHPPMPLEIDDLSRFIQQDPIFKLNDDGSLVETPLIVMDALLKFGHERWRPGQEEAVMRVLSGLSTLVTLSTGSGKSLCYQLPAYLYHTMQKRITIVVSPLVSLMEDQVYGVHGCLQIACLHTNQTPKVQKEVYERLRANTLHALLISPESLAVGDRIGELLRSLPQVAFACIDEAHCISQWSHNFRPSYLLICDVLRKKFGVKTILGLTATATVATIASISSTLELPDGVDGVIRDIPLPNNLQLSVSRDSNKDKALITLLKGDRFSQCQSIIVYCTRRDECQRLAAYIRTCLQDRSKEDGVAKRGSISWNAEAYHAGLTAARRRSIQKAFMSGETRIIVATVAFGMGINKQDIEGIIHYNMPSAFEKYVQEVGRAGRDGRIAHCHCFLNMEGKDLCELRRHIYADSVERHTIRKLLQRVFLPCKCGKECPSHEVAFSIDETVSALDLPQENITTLLCYLQLHVNQWVRVCSPVYTQCRVISYKGPKVIIKAAKECPPLAVALAMEAQKGVKLDSTSKIEFSIFNIASAIKWDSGVIKRELKNLEWTKDDHPRRSGLTVELYDLGFRVQAPGNLSGIELDSALNSLTSRVESQEITALTQLQAIFNILMQVSHNSVNECLNNIKDKFSERLKTDIRQYFVEENYLDRHNLVDVEIKNEDQVIADIRSLVNCYRDVSFSSRSIARIFHGIASPNFPAIQWSRNRFWRSHLHEDFKLICKLATRELIKMR